MSGPGDEPVEVGVPGTVLFVVVADFVVFFLDFVDFIGLAIGTGAVAPKPPALGFVLPPLAAPCVVSALPVGLFTVVEPPLLGLGEL